MNESGNIEVAEFGEDNAVGKESNEYPLNTNKVVLIKPFSLYRNESFNKDSVPVLENKRTKRLSGIVAIEEEVSEKSSPALNSKRFSFKRHLEPS